jgi:hypothetical protein
MKDISVKFVVPNVFVTSNKKTMLVPSMVLSTLSVCVLTTFAPQLMPLWMAWATRSQV